MRSTQSRLTHMHTLLGAALVAVAACAPAEEAGQTAAETMDNVPVEATSEASYGQELACFLARGTMEEAQGRPSPLSQTDFTVGDTNAKLCYGAPSARGRTIMGDLVPFGQPWRLGANEATAIHLSAPAEIGGVAVEAGSYSLYAVPSESEWEIVVNGNAERWGIPIDDGVMAQDVGSFMTASAATDEMMEQLTFTWESHGEGMGHIVMEWENTRVEIPVHSGM